MSDYDALQLAFMNGRKQGQRDRQAEIERLTAERDDAVADVLRLHNEKMDYFEKLISLEAERDRLLAALERLGSSETMTIPFAVDKSRTGEELQVRIQFARDAAQQEDSHA